jgi:hypothetical protein
MKTRMSMISLVLLAVVARGQDRVTVTRAADGTLEGTFLGIEGGDTLLLGGVGDGARRVPLATILRVAFQDIASPLPRGAVRVDLSSGDRIFGTIDAGNYDGIELGTAAVGAFKLFLDPVLRVVYMDNADEQMPALEDASRERDLLVLKVASGLDRLPGEVQRMDRTGVVFESAAGGERHFSFIQDRVVMVRLAQLDPYEEPAGLLCVASFRDGTRLTGRLSGDAAGGLKLALTVGPTVEIDRRLLRSLEFKSESFRYVADLERTAYREIPFLEGGLTHGLREDRGPRDEPVLQIGDKTFRRGIALHAKSEVTYDTGGRYDVFQAQVGLDPATRDRAIVGNARLRIRADDKVVWESDLLVAGTHPTAVRVEGLDGAKSLSITADFGTSFGTGAWVILGDAMLLKE